MNININGAFILLYHILINMCYVYIIDLHIGLGKVCLGRLSDSTISIGNA